MASNLTQKGRLEVVQQAVNLVSEAALKMVLVQSSYVHDTLRDFVDDATANDIASHEVTATGYTGGFNGADRIVPASRAFNRDDPNTRIEFDFADNTWTALGNGVNETIGWVALIVEKTADTDSWVISVDDTNDVTTNGGDITYSPNAEGVIQF